jgi:Mlc titration factor MtfA (ptsG expression regulator)
MWGRLLGLWSARRERAALRRRAIPEDLWKRTLVRFPFLQRQDAAAGAELRRLTSLFLDSKEFSGAGGLVLSDAMVVAIAAQAVLPVLRLGLRRYDGFVGIVVHPDQVRVQREVSDEDGIVHAYEEVLAGEAVQGGPIMLSWHDVRSAGQGSGPAYNVVIHEFAHVLDMADGAANGIPLLDRGWPVHEWVATLDLEFDRLTEWVAQGRETVLDAYGAQGKEEFFAVASEAFFISPREMQQTHPALYAMLSRFYRQDPAVELPPAALRGGRR